MFLALRAMAGGHAESWLTHGVSLTGLTPRFITAELTMVPLNLAMAELIPIYEKSLADALAEIDSLWAQAQSTPDRAHPWPPNPRRPEEVR